MNSGKVISILGCGWLGLPLAQKLIKAGYQVKGSTTTPAKEELLAAEGISPFLIDLKLNPPALTLQSFLTANYLVVAFPPGLRAGQGENFLQQINSLAQSLESQPALRVLFISSTSVYPDLNKTFYADEDLSEYLQNNVLLQAENKLKAVNAHTTVLRFGGLVGGTRQPGRFLAAKQNVSNPDAPVNLIHLNDCLELITEIISQGCWGKTYNGCADKHPTRQEFYTAAANKLNLPPPAFAPPTPEAAYKIISSEKIKKDLAYRFIHPDPMLFI